MIPNLYLLYGNPKQRIGRDKHWRPYVILKESNGREGFFRIQQQSPLHHLGQIHQVQRSLHGSDEHSKGSGTSLHMTHELR